MKALFFTLCFLFVTHVSHAKDGALSDGLQPNCVDQPLFHCRAGTADKMVLLFIHGWGGNSSFWKYQLPYFSKQYSVITVDLPGYGQSVAYKNEVTVRGIAKVLGSFLEQLDLNNVVLVGHDLGAFVALATTATLSGTERVLGVVALESLVDTQMVVPKKQYRRVLKCLKNNFTATAKQMTRDLFSDTADPALVDWISNAVASSDSTITLSLLDDFFHLDLTAELLLFAGQLMILNTHFNPPNIEKLLKLSPRVSFYEAPWEEHFIFLERPQLFNQKLDQLLHQFVDKNR